MSALWLGFCVVSLAACAPAQPQVALFSDDFDAGTSEENWVVYSHAGDYTADFAFDYGPRGIPPAPNSVGGSTIGLQFTVNNNDDVAAADAVSAYPVATFLDGEYTLKFDMWLNYNGGAGGGSGSTEFATAGLNHAGDQVVWQNNVASDGYWFAVTGEGGASNDYCVYRNATLLSAAVAGQAAVSRNHTDVFYQSLFPSPSYETQGAPGKHWVEVEISQRGGVIEWRLNGMLIAIRLDTASTAGNVMLGYMDTYSSIANPAVDNFVIFDNLRIEQPDCNQNAVPDAQDLVIGTSLDCNANGRPDDCETIPAGDLDNDGDTDAVDFAAFTEHMSGVDLAPNPPEPACIGAGLAAFDVNHDGDVDVADFADLQRRCTTGSFPPRPTGAPTGSQFLAEIAGLDRTARESRVMQEITGGNVPGFMRSFIPINVSANISGSPVSATYYVSPDYLCIGRDTDFVRMPPTPLVGQPIADALGCLLPTRKMVDDIYAQAEVKLAPSPISPATVDITRATTFYRHHQRVEEQRAGQTLGALVGGIKKDVVITPQLESHPNRVAIYGWHQLNGQPIQPLYLGHVDYYVDYSHGIRLVQQKMLVDGVEMSVADVLADPDLHVLLSDEGVVLNPSY